MVTVQGTLKGYDALMNLVLDDGKETVRGQSSSPFLPYPMIGELAMESKVR